MRPRETALGLPRKRDTSHGPEPDRVDKVVPNAPSAAVRDVPSHCRSGTGATTGAQQIQVGGAGAARWCEAGYAVSGER
ncbi:hypothetical protein Sros01_29730 [Streptomyces roseochromogenus]|nr:hypothetical protein Sros01_29730 [Streptomyces roseochromogenus]